MVQSWTVPVAPVAFDYRPILTPARQPTSRPAKLSASQPAPKPVIKFFVYTTSCVQPWTLANCIGQCCCGAYVRIVSLQRSKGSTRGQFCCITITNRSGQASLVIITSTQRNATQRNATQRKATQRITHKTIENLQWQRNKD